MSQPAAIAPTPAPAASAHETVDPTQKTNIEGGVSYQTVTSTLALLVSAFAIYISLTSRKLSQGQVEMQITATIEGAKTSNEEFILGHGEALASPEDSERRTLLKKVFEARDERLVNAYDHACQKYIDGKVDKTRFKKAWQREIRNIVKSHGPLFNNVDTSYPAIVKVFKEWEDPEKK